MKKIIFVLVFVATSVMTFAQNRAFSEGGLFNRNDMPAARGSFGGGDAKTVRGSFGGDGSFSNTSLPENQYYRLNHSKVSGVSNADYPSATPTAASRSLVRSDLSFGSHTTSAAGSNAGSLSAFGGSNNQIASTSGFGTLYGTMPMIVSNGHGQFELGHHAVLANIGDEISEIDKSSSYWLETPHEPTPLGDAIAPLMLLVLAFVAFKFWKR